MSSLSVLVITKNEEHNIDDCLSSVTWADELVVVDSYSTDRTSELARKYTDKVMVTEWLGYAATKNLALEHCQSDWILWIDADERITPESRREIEQLLASDPPENGFEIPRKAYFLGRWIAHCGWYPGYVLRLFRRSKGTFNDKQVHEGVELEGERGQLQEPLLHFTDPDLEHYMQKFNRYTSLAADELYQRGRRAGAFSIIFRPLHMFLKMYILRRGFLDGIQGFILCLLSSGYVAMKYAKLWEKAERISK